MHSLRKNNSAPLLRKFRSVRGCLLFVGLLASSACQTWPDGTEIHEALSSEQDTTQSDRAQDDPASGQDNIVIEEAELPDAILGKPYEFRFHGHGSVPPLHWKLDSGPASLPKGMTVTEQGVLQGTPASEGEFRFTVALMDNSVPQQGAQRVFTLRVISGLSLLWKTLAHVTGNRIDGLAQVTNATSDDVDLTFDAKAVAENGRATEIGYQHFPLKRGTVNMEIPFGETLPRGTYRIYLLAVGEVASKKLIYKQQLEMNGRLTITVGP
jgi:hypothetical protein